MTDTPVYPPVPGPVDRESFFDAQARNRRASWWFTALSAGAIAVMGIPLSAVISPLLYAFLLILTDVVRLVLHAPHVVLHHASGTGGPTPAIAYVVGALLLVLPGSLVLLAAWVGVRRIYRRAGAGGTVLALGAREPHATDLEEQQLANVAGEMAVAAGVPPPAVRIIDSDVPNAAAVGRDVDDATVVVTTGLLRALSRDETQAVVGHLVASAGNGDLRIGTTIGSVFGALGLVGSVLRAPAEGRPRTTLRRLLRYAFRSHTVDDAAAVAETLTHEGVEWETDPNEAQPSGVRSMLLIPFMVAGAAFAMTSWVFSFVLVNPFLRRAWRSRKYLADAAAVELTRDPDALARALTKLRASGDVVPGTDGAAHLFVVGGDFNAPVPKRVERLRAMGAGTPSLLTHRSRKQNAILATFLVITSPLWIAFFLLMLSVGLLMTMVSLMVDSLFLAPVVALIHALLT